MRGAFARSAKKLLLVFSGDLVEKGDEFERAGFELDADG